VTCNGGGTANLFELGNGLWDASRPNTLYPDGIYSEKDRAPAYLDRGNADGFHGVIGFWVKSNHAPSLLLRGHRFLKWSRSGQFFFLGDTTGDVACMFEITISGYDEDKEHLFLRHRMLTPQQWSLVTMYYDFRSPGKDDCGELLLDAGIEDADKGPSDEYHGSTGNDPASARDITQDLPHRDGGFRPHRLDMGKGHPEHGMGNFTGSGADSTFDELAIYDFGGATLPPPPPPSILPSTPASADTLASPGVLAANRFKEGRYYKESAYPAAGLAVPVGADLDGDLLPDRRAAEYFSPLIHLGACRILALAWTQVVPRGLKAPFPLSSPPSQPGVDGDRDDGDNPGDGRILLELADALGESYLKDAAGQPLDKTFASPASSPVDRMVAAPFRLHAVFQPNLADKENTPILDPLALDDVTVVYEPLGGRRLLTWEQH
jgi:hypothetical protein